jgi:glycerol kinase
MDARGAIVGLTRGVNRAHVVRATLESMAYQTRDVVEVMNADSGVPLGELRVDGGAAANDLLMQFQADVLGVPVQRPELVETTAAGAAFLAGLGAGFWRGPEELREVRKVGRTFTPALEPERREALYEGWKRAVRQVRTR